jgi:putative hydrolase of the HAD superfamily
MIKAVVFDLDDTLYPERAYAYSGFEAVAGQFADRLGDPAESAAAMRRLLDTEHRMHVFNALLADRGFEQTGKLVSAMIDAYRGHRPVISLYEDADAALTRLRTRHSLGIITDGRIIQQAAKIEALGLSPRVDAIILTNELGPGFAKPHPRPFELMADRLSAAHAECVYVADNPAKDFVAPNALGWITVRITRPDGVYNDAPTAEGGVPQHVISSLDELDGLVS